MFRTVCVCEYRVFTSPSYSFSYCTSAYMIFFIINYLSEWWCGCLNSIHGKLISMQTYSGFFTVLAFNSTCKLTQIDLSTFYLIYWFNWIKCNETFIFSRWNNSLYTHSWMKNRYICSQYTFNELTLFWVWK